MAIDNGEGDAVSKNILAQGGPSLSDTILAMDIADTIRHDDRLREFEMADGDRRKAMRERLRQAYAAQGDIVSDDVLDRAIAKMNEDRYVHRQKVNGVSGVLWKAYIRRGVLAKRASVGVVATVAVVGASFFGYDQLVAKPRVAAESKLAMQVEVLMPRELGAAVEYARAFAVRLDDKAALGRIEERKSSVETALVAKDVSAASSGIALIKAVGEELKHREQAEAQAVADAQAREADIARKAEVSARLLPQLANVTRGPLSEIKDVKAKAALADIAAQMRDAAVDGNEQGYTRAYERFKSFAGYIRSPYKIQIVSRSGIQTGFARKLDQTGAKTWYLVVEAVSPTGTAYPLEIKDRLLSGTKTTATWAIRVSERVVEAVKKDKSDGVIDNNVAGTKAAGTLDIVWSIEAFDGQTLNTW